MCVGEREDGGIDDSDASCRDIQYDLFYTRTVQYLFPCKQVQGVQEFRNKSVVGLRRIPILPYMKRKLLLCRFESTIIDWQDRAGWHFTTVKDWGFWSRILRERACNIADSEISLNKKRVSRSKKWSNLYSIHCHRYPIK
jgi:hypothetical protein